MSRRLKGIRLPLSPARRLLMEMLHHARKVPSIPVARQMNVAALAQARARSAAPLSWTALFLRAYALVGQRFPELRRTYIPYPFPHIYEHPRSVGALVIEREMAGETVLLAVKIRTPEEMSLETMQGHIRRYKQSPIEKVSAFRQLLRIGRLPWLLRRFIFWSSLYWSGSTRAKRFGTFMVSSYGSLGAEQVHPLTPLSTLLTFGPIGDNGDVAVKVIYDHRIMDGRRIAQALGELQTILNTQMVEEVGAVGAGSPRPYGLRFSA